MKNYQVGKEFKWETKVIISYDVFIKQSNNIILPTSMCRHFHQDRLFCWNVAMMLCSDQYTHLSQVFPAALYWYKDLRKVIQLKHKQASIWDFGIVRHFYEPQHVVSKNVAFWHE